MRFDGTLVPLFMYFIKEHRDIHEYEVIFILVNVAMLYCIFGSTFLSG